MKSLLLPVTLGTLVAALAASGCSQQDIFKKPPPQMGDLATKFPSKMDKPAAPAAAPQQSKAGDPLMLAQLAQRRGQHAQAEEMYKELIRKNPRNAAPHHGIGVMYAKQSRFREAEEHFQQALALEPSNAKLLNDLGYLCYLDSRLDDAEKYLRRAVEKERNNPAYCNNLALVLGEQGQYDQAFELFRRAGTERQAQSNIAFVLAQRGDYQNSIDMHNRVLTSNPKSRTAAQAMVQLANASKDKKAEVANAPRLDAPVDRRQELASAAVRTPESPAQKQRVEERRGTPLDNPLQPQKAVAGTVQHKPTESVPSLASASPERDAVPVASNAPVWPETVAVKRASYKPAVGMPEKVSGSVAMAPVTDSLAPLQSEVAAKGPRWPEMLPLPGSTRETAQTPAGKSPTADELPTANSSLPTANSSLPTLGRPNRLMASSASRFPHTPIVPIQPQDSVFKQPETPSARVTHEKADGPDTAYQPVTPHVAHASVPRAGTADRAAAASGNRWENRRPDPLPDLRSVKATKPSSQPIAVERDDAAGMADISDQ